ncbi:hypothetical protein SDC9_210710 [bioreactor metagenome]|uniref:Uncharacterized protein n=1 Tax=bioreactor metagenome TaxID=1076179 RepID=A0A645JHX9_9ZZZZ
MQIEIAKGIELLKIEFVADSADDYTTAGGLYSFRKKPRIIRLTLSMFDSPAVKALEDAGASATVVDDKKTETMRTFTKIVFLQ